MGCANMQQHTVGRQPQGCNSVWRKGFCNIATAAFEEQGQPAARVHVIHTDDEKKFAAAATLDSSTLPPQPASSSNLAIMSV